MPLAAAVAPALAIVAGPSHGEGALETAVLDAELRRGPAMGEEFGADARVGRQRRLGRDRDSLAELLDEVDGYLAAGYRRIKLKIEPGWDVEPVGAVRERVGDVPLQVDANTAYTRDDGPLLAALDPFDLLLIEQPLAEDDVAGHAELRRSRTPICLDESIASASRRRQAIARRRLDHQHQAWPCRRLPRGVRVHDVCVRGVPVWCGGMLETGMGRAANVALAALPGLHVAGGHRASDRYFTGT